MKPYSGATVAFVLYAAFFPGLARANPLDSPVIVLSVPEGKGCYWFHGQLFCGRYCYTEINGKRYCREDELEAVSQAPR